MPVLSQMDLYDCPQISNNIWPRSPDITVLLLTQWPILRHELGAVEIGCLPPPGSRELHRRTSTKLFEKGTNHFCCPAVCGLLSVPCPGWCVKHVFRLIGSHIHPDPLPSHGLPSPCCGCALCGPSQVLLIHTHLRWLIPNLMHVLHI